MPPVPSPSQTALPPSLYKFLTTSITEAIAWLGRQGHNVPQAITWTIDLIATTARTIASAPAAAIHLIKTLSIAKAKFLLLLIGGLIVALIVLRVLIALYDNRTRLLSYAKSAFQLLHALVDSIVDWHSSRRQDRLFDRVDLPSGYGTMEDHHRPRTTVRRVTVEELMGPGLHRKAVQSETRYADGRREVKVAAWERLSVPSG